MAQDFLSQEEVDALLKGVNGETEAAEPEHVEGGGVKPYDLGRQERIVRGRMPTLELINERFARLLRIGLFNHIHKGTEISVGPIKVQKYSEFIRNLVVPTNLNLVTVKPLRGTALVVLDPNLVFLVVDSMFGGDGRFHTRVEGRDFTATEQRIIHGLLNVIFTEYEKAWKPVFEIKFEYVRSEMNTQFANIATPSEIVIAITFTIDLGGNSSEMHLCLPYSMVEPIRDVLYSTMHSEQAGTDRRWNSMLARELQLAEVELVVPLAGCDLPVSRVVELKVGDIIPLQINDRVAAMVDGISVMDCRYGVRNGQYALKVEHFLAQDEAEAGIGAER